MENAHVDERKEVLVQGRAPTAQGTKKFNDCLNVCVKKPDCNKQREQQNMDKVYQSIPALSDRTITKQRLAVDIDHKIGLDRLDPDLLKAYRENPYTQRLDSVA